MLIFDGASNRLQHIFLVPSKLSRVKTRAAAAAMCSIRRSHVSVEGKGVGKWEAFSL